jgi:hypothetical protein
MTRQAEAPVRAAATKPELAAPVVPAAQPDAPQPSAAVASIAPKLPLAPAKAAPPHFFPRPVTNEIAGTPAPKNIATQKPPVTLGTTDAPVYRPTAVAPARSRELQAANFVWFGAGLVLVGLVSFGYPVIRGRLDGAVAELVKSEPLRFLRRIKQSPERIRLDTAAVRQAMDAVEQEFEKETPVETPASAPEPDAPADDSAVSALAPNSVPEPVAEASKPADAPVCQAAPQPATAAESKVAEPPIDSMKAAHPKPRAPHREETPEARERRLAWLKEMLNIPPSGGENPESCNNGTATAEVSAPPSGNDSRESSSVATPSAS